MNQDLRDSIDGILMCPRCDEDFIKRIANTNRICIEEKYLVKMDPDDKEYILVCAHNPMKRYDLDAHPFDARRSYIGDYWIITNTCRRRYIPIQIEWLSTLSEDFKEEEAKVSLF